MVKEASSQLPGSNGAESPCDEEHHVWNGNKKSGPNAMEIVEYHRPLEKSSITFQSIL